VRLGTHGKGGQPLQAALSVGLIRGDQKGWVSDGIGIFQISNCHVSILADRLAGIALRQNVCDVQVHGTLPDETAGVSVHISSEVRAISALNSALEVKAMRGGLADSASAERCTKSIPPTQDLPTATGDGKGFFIDDFRT